MHAVLSPARLDALRRLELLDTPPDDAFDRLTRLAAATLDAPVALVSLVDADQQFFKSVCDVAELLGGARSTPLSHSFCKHAVQSGAPLLIDDARRDARVADNPAVRSLGVVAYAGAPLVTVDGHVLGTLCVLDARPRRWTERDERILTDLAAVAMAEVRARTDAAERRRARDELGTAIGQMQALLDNVPYLAWVKDTASRYLAVNVAQARAIGRPAHEIVGKTDAELFPPERARLHVASDRATLERGEQMSFEESHADADGSRRLFETVKTPFRDAAGGWAGTTGVARDVTVRRHAEEALRASERYFRALIEQAHDPISIIDEQGIIRYASPAFERVFHYPIAEAVGRDGLEPVHPDDRARVNGILAELLQRPGGRTTATMRYRRRDGAWCTIDVVATNLLAEPTIRGIVCNSHDITERGVADEARRESEERYRRHVEMSQDGIVVHSGGRVVLANPAAARLLGYGDASSLLGVPALDLVHPDDRALVTERVAHLGSSGGPLPVVEERLLRADGSVVDAEVVGIPMTYEGRPAVQATFRDLVARKRAEAALRQTEEQLRQSQKMEAVGQLAGGIAHDFNNLLTVIGASTEFLFADLDAGDPRREDVAEIRGATERATRLTRQLLAFSRKQILKPHVLDLNGVARALQPMLARLIGEDIVVETDLATDLGRVMADAGQLEQVLVNLAVNARDAMPGGGRLRIETRNVSLDAAAAGAAGEGTPAGPCVMLSVSDTGTGMPPEVRARAFEPFFTTKPAGKGTGLGLATVYGIVRQSGGHVCVYSEPGLGSTFKIYLPRLADTAAEAIAESVIAPSPGGSETLLLVEDEDAVRGLASRILARRGYSVLTARGGHEALALAAGHPGAIHLVLTDVVMPEMSGRTLAERLTAIRPNVRVLYMSGYTDDDIIRRGILRPGAAFVQKPFSANSLLRAVRVALG